MRTFLIGLGLVIPAALILLIGFKLSDDALAVIIGMILGILASVPLSLLTAFTLLQREKASLRQMQSGQSPYGQSHQPPVIVVNGGNQPPYANPPQSSSGQTLAPPTSPRTFTVIGDESTEL